MPQLELVKGCPYIAEGWLSYFLCNHPSIFILTITSIFAIISAIIALWSMFSARKGQRIVNTVNFLWNIIRDKDFISAQNVLVALSKNNDELTRYGLPANYEKMEQSEREKVDKIRVLLSTWEGVALAIQFNGYEEKMLKLALKSPCVNHYKIAEPFIVTTRSKLPNAAKEWQSLVKKWSA